MTHTVVQCPGCLSKLKFHSDTNRKIANCPRCDESIDVQLILSRHAASETQHSVSGDSPASGAHAPVESARASRVSRRESQPAPLQVESSLQVEELDPDELRAKRESIIFLAIIGVALLFSLIAFPSAIYYLMNPDSDEAIVADKDSAVVNDEVPVQREIVAPLDRSGQTKTAQNGSDTAPGVAAGNVQPPATMASISPAVIAPSNAVPSSPIPSSPKQPRQAVVQPRAAEPSSQPPEADVVAGKVTATGSESALRYNWLSGQKHVYSLKIVSDNGAAKENITGSCTYQVMNNGIDHSEEQEGSGSGFVVSADGYIGTCAHVVDGAKRIEVTIGEKTYTGQVVAEDAKRDLAVVKIAASGLPVSRFADSDNVKLAEQVRAFGFPLSSVLGTGVKVATGAVAGIVLDPEQGRQIQTDAPINPGNSGGPVVNSSGQVIGIASSKLHGRAADSVGFAVPVNEIKTMMAALSLPLPGAGSSEVLDGPTLASQVTPTVAYIKVHSISGGRLFDIDYQASFTQTRRIDPRQMRFDPFSMLPSGSGGRGELKVSAFGEIASATGDGDLPFVLGPIGQFFIDPLSANGANSWGSTRETTLRVMRSPAGNPADPLSRIRSRMPFPPTRGGFGGRGFPGGSPFGQPEEKETVKEIPAIAETTYRRGDELNNRVTIHKSFDFTTTDDVNQPYLSVRGKGEIVFDKSLGMPSSLDYTATLTRNNDDGAVTSIPITITFQLRDPEEVERERAAAADRAQQMRVQKEQQRTIPDPERLTALLAEVRKANGSFSALSSLKTLADVAIVSEMRIDVLQAASNHMENSNDFVKAAAAEVFVKWATDEHVDTLKKIAKSDHHMLRNARELAIERLIEMNTPGLLPELVRQMSDSSLRYELKKILIAAGEPVEEPILNAFGDVTDAAVRRDLVEIIKSVGTEKSVPFLEDLSNGNDISLKFSAQRALDAVRSRK